MNYLLLQYPKCSTCKKAQNLLNWGKVSYKSRNIAEDNPTAEELREWIEKSGLPIQKFFNSNGVVYKDMNLKDKLAEMTDDEKIELLATNGMLIKRPIIIGEDKVLVGFKEAEWKKL